MTLLTPQQLTGQSDSHVTDTVEGSSLHPTAAQAFRNMQSAAQLDGISVNIASGFRSYARQKSIWNRKFESLSSSPTVDNLHKILRWSALPGASRHHWGTDIDVYDKSGFEHQRLQLIPEEYQQDGPCYQLNCWLDSYAHKFGFYRPYDQDRGGVTPEPWHLSYAPVAEHCMSLFSLEVLRQALENDRISGQAVVLEHLDSLFERYTQAITRAPNDLLPED